VCVRRPINYSRDLIQFQSTEFTAAAAAAAAAAGTDIPNIRQNL